MKKIKKETVTHDIHFLLTIHVNDIQMSEIIAVSMQIGTKGIVHPKMKFYHFNCMPSTIFGSQIKIFLMKP